MTEIETSIILIGMPGSGKSTLGAQLAQRLVKPFVDTDDIIKTTQQQSLQTIVDQQGYLHLRALEENIILNTRFANQVIATGGSAVYSESAMDYLKHQGPIIFLDVSLEELTRRINNVDTRGLARQPNQSLADLFSERYPLYQKYADITINCNDKSIDKIINEIIYNEAETYAEEDA